MWSPIRALFRRGRWFGPQPWIWTSMAVFGASATLFSASLFALPAEVRVPVVKEHGKADPPASGLFSHWRHDQFQCFDCHPILFPRTRVGFTHDQMDDGKFCGACHNGKAAPPISGARAVCKSSCHTP
jgi:c(7)-type cytochrome triheme protein